MYPFVNACLISFVDLGTSFAKKKRKREKWSDREIREEIVEILLCDIRG